MAALAAAPRPPRPTRRASTVARAARAPKATASAPAAELVRIRMYRLGIGDCFLLRLPRRDGTPFSMLIDCGVHMAEPQGPERIRAVAEDIVHETDGKLDVVVGTHEHWDHLSGFFHAKTAFADCQADAVWCAWTEDATDPLAKSLLETRAKGVTALWQAVRRREQAGAPASDSAAAGILGFFGDSPGAGTKAKEAAAALRRLAGGEDRIRYHRPGEPPFDSASDDWRIFVLGPPRNPKALNQADPHAHSNEAYPFAAGAMATAERAAANLAEATNAADASPFGRRYQVSLDETRTDPFFQSRYWAGAAPDACPGEDPDQQWRQVGTAWLDGDASLALMLDRITNNTSLVLALELGPPEGRDNPVILFAADAQIGNWLSWNDVDWGTYHGRPVTGADLIRRTVVYKVGHHASRNATLMQGGLEAMSALRLALVPTSAATAGKVGWGRLPAASLLARLEEVTSHHVLRSDTGASGDPAGPAGISVEVADTHFDIAIPLELRLGR